ncbi:DUF1761 family protein [Hyunsoonleella pacifica]|uniref:DUF1761 family protein n=1 Tax=Hyunsoonleella pacifica TaxID=1080224 RepID=A0A4Q9FMK9_9FLAO|nr:DUF1761 family protein [Hyunsoonleella pacifica]TBN15441.1 DUF1761 family protein [Hyunsoonleella pacifica]GGD24133.1 hypothetical protein GCM10011368_27720 [Hyunsoonleella pacifica]
MKTKHFLVSGIVGGIVDFLLGWLFYGIIFIDTFPQPEESGQTMLFIFLGCLTFGLFVSYIYNRWAQITTAATGAKAGAIIGLFIGLFYNFFNIAMYPEFTFQLAALDVGISIVMTTIIGAAIGAINGKLG